MLWLEGMLLFFSLVLEKLFSSMVYNSNNGVALSLIGRQHFVELGALEPTMMIYVTRTLSYTEHVLKKEFYRKWN